MHNANPNHPNHDVMLIVGHAAGDLAESERTRAQALLDTCDSCRDLRRDLVAIAGATRALPNLAVAPHDFRLTPEQAAGLRRTNWWHAILASFSGSRSAARPVAAAFTTLGIAGLLVATMLPGLAGSSASLGTARDQTTTGAAAPAGPATAGPAAPEYGADQPAPVASAGMPGYPGGGKDVLTATSAPEIADVDGAGNGAPNGPTSGPLDSSERQVSSTSPNPLLIGSLALLAAGLLLFGLRFAGRRLR